MLRPNVFQRNAQLVMPLCQDLCLVFPAPRAHTSPARARISATSAHRELTRSLLHLQMKQIVKVSFLRDRELRVGLGFWGVRGSYLITNECKKEKIMLMCYITVYSFMSITYEYYYV